MIPSDKAGRMATQPMKQVGASASGLGPKVDMLISGGIWGEFPRNISCSLCLFGVGLNKNDPCFFLGNEG